MNDDLLPCPRGCPTDHLVIKGTRNRWVSCIFCGWRGPVTWGDKANAIAAWNTRAPAPSSWQDIATAPKDGTSILAVTDEYHGGPLIVAWHSCAWFDMETDTYSRITHWMPLPEPPK